jgi:hypothetical protein
MISYKIKDQAKLIMVIDIKRVVAYGVNWEGG